MLNLVMLTSLITSDSEKVPLNRQRFPDGSWNSQVKIMEVNTNESSMEGNVDQCGVWVQNQKKFPVNVLLVWTIWDAVPYSYENTQQNKAKTHPCYRALAALAINAPSYTCSVFCYKSQKLKQKLFARVLLVIAVPQTSAPTGLQSPMKIRQKTFLLQILLFSQ